MGLKSFLNMQIGNCNRGESYVKLRKSLGQLKMTGPSALACVAKHPVARHVVSLACAAFYLEANRVVKYS